jgi:hypothetical protein
MQDPGRFSDFAPGYDFTGPLDQTLPLLRDYVDVYVCTETLEHLDDPAMVLRMIRAQSRLVAIISIPIDAWEDPKPEHYCAWDREGVESLLAEVN